MNKLNLAIALAIALPTAAFAQQAATDAAPSTMPCCERDAEDNMAGCAHMNGDHGMNHDGAMHQGMDHQNMDHDTMNHDAMDHGSMDHDGDADAHAGHPMGAQ